MPESDHRVRITIVDSVTLEQLALKNYLRRGRGRNGNTLKNKRNGFGNFLLRIQVNYVRHHLTEYDKSLEKHLSGTGDFERLHALTTHVLKEISLNYPSLAGECERQIAELSM